MTLLLLVRHGETALNAARVLQPADTPLSARGLLQAQAVAARIAGLRPAAVVTSDLPRALQTAQAIVAACRAGRADGGDCARGADAAGGGAANPPLVTTPLLQERNFGAWRGRSYADCDFNAVNTPAAPPGGESWAQFAARVDAAFALLLQRHADVGAASGRPLVAVTHGLVIRALLQRLPLGAGCALPERLGNTGITAVDSRAPHTVTLANCLMHLDALPAG